ncbi:MAG: hypothetical protein AB1611_05770 [bacterium]
MFSLLLSGTMFATSKAEAARDGSEPIQNIFVDTLYGVATGLVLGAAITAAKGEGHGDEWGENLGAGAAIGGLLGAGYGVFLEYSQSLAEVNNSGVCFHIPTLALSSGSGAGDASIHADFLRVRF